MDGENLEKTTDTDVNEKIEDDEVIEPVGTDNLSSLEKRISELEDTIEEYENLEERISELEDKTEEYESLKDNLTNLEKTIGSGSSDPIIYFREFEDTDYKWSHNTDSECFTQFNCTNLYEGDNFVFCSASLPAHERCVLSIVKYDADGWIEMISFETTAGDFEVRGYNGGPSLCYTEFYRIAPNNTVGCLGLYSSFSDSLTTFDICDLEPVNQTITVSVYDNDGNSAEAEYDLDYDAVCNASFGR
jgi:hypothetical protein